MASVQHYVCDADVFPLEIIKKHAALQDVEKEHHFAALKIQRLWRGYVVRKEVARWNRAATVLQKYIRRWLVVWHLPDIYRDYQDWYREQFYNRNATKIQALWRGYWVRRDRVPIKELLARRLAIAQANEDVKREMQEAFKNMEKIKQQQMEQEARAWVLYILFKLHHLLRTKCRKGIYSVHNRKVSPIEELLQLIPMKDFMQEMKKLYYEGIKVKKPPPPYLFQSKKLHRLEDIYRSRDRSREPRDIFEPDRNIHSKPFKLTPKIDEKGYTKMMFCTEKYPSSKFDFARPVEKAKHVSVTDFDLHVLKKVICELKPPPYHTGFWSELCDIHNMPD